HYDESIHFGGAPLGAAEDQDGFVAKLSPAGVQQWIVGVGASGTQRVSALSVRANGDIVAAGHYSGTLDAGTTPLPGFGMNDVFALEIGSAGDIAWIRGWGGAHEQTAKDVITTA